MLKKILFIVILLGFYANCSANANNKILIFGDSLSASYGVEISQGWVSLLQKRLAETHPNVKVINASISGNTTAEGLTRLQATLVREKPNILILELGANDGLRGIPLKVTQENLAKMIVIAQQQRIKILLIGLRLPPNYGPIYTKQFIAIFPSLAKQYHVALVPQLLAGIDTNMALVQADGLHPTAQAQPQVMENVWQALQKLLRSI